MFEFSACPDVSAFGQIGGSFVQTDTNADFSDGTVDTLFEASVRQDLTPIDPDNPEVELEVFGAADIVDGNVTGDASVRLSFAGRRFESDARGFDLFEDLTEPLVITNQDGVILTLMEAENGDLTGSLTVDGEVEATLSDSSGVLIATFNDGSFISVN